MGSNRGQNDNSYALYEELEGRLRVDPYAEPPYIYKRDDPHLKQSLEDRAWQIRVLIPNSKGTFDIEQKFISALFNYDIFS